MFKTQALGHFILNVSWLLPQPCIFFLSDLSSASPLPGSVQALHAAGRVGPEEGSTRAGLVGTESGLKQGLCPLCTSPSLFSLSGPSVCSWPSLHHLQKGIQTLSPKCLCLDKVSCGLGLTRQGGMKGAALARECGDSLLQPGQCWHVVSV
jgi:hypothetical protein